MKINMVKSLTMRMSTSKTSTHSVPSRKMMRKRSHPKQSNRILKVISKVRPNRRSRTNLRMKIKQINLMLK